MRELISRVDQILLEDWDPIGVNGIPEASDEYSSYAPGLLRIAMRGNPESVADQLRFISSEQMGLGGESREHDMKIAQKLIDLAYELDLD